VSEAADKGRRAAALRVHDCGNYDRQQKLQQHRAKFDSWFDGFAAGATCPSIGFVKIGGPAGSISV